MLSKLLKATTVEPLTEIYNARVTCFFSFVQASLGLVFILQTLLLNIRVFKANRVPFSFLIYLFHLTNKWNKIRIHCPKWKTEKFCGTYTLLRNGSTDFEMPIIGGKWPTWKEHLLASQLKFWSKGKNKKACWSVVSWKTAKENLEAICSTS